MAEQQEHDRAVIALMREQLDEARSLMAAAVSLIDAGDLVTLREGEWWERAIEFVADDDAETSIDEPHDSKGMSTDG